MQNVGKVEVSVLRLYLTQDLKNDAASLTMARAYRLPYYHFLTLHAR